MRKSENPQPMSLKKTDQTEYTVDVYCDITELCEKRSRPKELLCRINNNSFYWPKVSTAVNSQCGSCSHRIDPKVIISKTLNHVTIRMPNPYNPK